MLARQLFLLQILLLNYSVSTMWAWGQSLGNQARAVRQPRRLALLIGVGKYYQLQPGHDQSPWPTLHTGDEIEEYRQVLIRNYGFADRDILVLLDHRASKSAIQQAFRKHLIEQAGPGDVIAFHFSGHGQKLPDDTDPQRRDEPDGLDESLVPYDALNQSVQEGIAKNIRDDELGVWLEELAARMRPSVGKPIMGNITVTLDTCFSGSATRSPLVPRGRGWDIAKDGPVPLPRVEKPNESGAGILAPSAAAQRDIVVVAAARADQTAWERNGEGVFTRHWVRLLAQADQRALPSYHAAVDRLAIDLSSEGLEQTPQVEGAGQKQLFATETSSGRQPIDTLRAYRQNDGSLRLQAGEVHGVTRGSSYDLYEAGTALSPQTLVGHAEVFEVGPFDAVLHLEKGTILTGRSGVAAVESRHSYSLPPIRVLLTGFEGAPELRAQIGHLEMVRVVKSIGSGQDSQQDYDLELKFLSVDRRIAFFRPDSMVPLMVVTGELSTADELARRLVSQWRRKHLMSLRRDGVDSRVDLELLPTGVRRDSEGIPKKAWRLSAPLPALHLRLPKRRAVGLRLHNRSSRDLFVAVLAISPDGDIDVMFGRELGKNRLRFGETVEMPLMESFQLIGRPGERIVIKLITTDRPVMFSSIGTTAPLVGTRSTAVTDGSTVTSNPLAELLQSFGVATRGLDMAGPTDWSITEGSVTIE